MVEETAGRGAVYKPGSMRGFSKTPKNEPMAMRMIKTKKIA
jgi:hypothetical protein